MSDEHDEAIEERLQRLEDERRIEALFPRYARFVDDGDAAGIPGMFAKNGKMVVSGGHTIKGSEKIGQLFGKLLGDIKASNHLVGHPLVTWTGACRALAEAAFQAWDSYKDGRPDCYTYGRYLLEVARSASGEWEIETFTFDFATQLNAPRP